MATISASQVDPYHLSSRQRQHSRPCSAPTPNQQQEQIQIPSVSKVGSYSIMMSDGQYGSNSIDDGPFGSSSFDEIRLPDVPNIFSAGAPNLLPKSHPNPYASHHPPAANNADTASKVSRRASHHVLSSAHQARDRNGDGHDGNQEVFQRGNNIDSRIRNSDQLSSSYLDEDGKLHAGMPTFALEPAWDDAASNIDSTSRRSASSLSDHDRAVYEEQNKRASEISELSGKSTEYSRESLSSLLDQMPTRKWNSESTQELERQEAGNDKITPRHPPINKMPYLKDPIFDSLNGWNPNLRAGTSEGAPRINAKASPTGPVPPQRSASRRVGNAIMANESQKFSPTRDAIRSSRPDEGEGCESEQVDELRPLPMLNSTSCPSTAQIQSDRPEKLPVSGLVSNETLLSGPSEDVVTPTSSTFNRGSVINQKAPVETFEVESLRRQVEQLQMALLQKSQSEKEVKMGRYPTQTLDLSTPSQERSTVGYHPDQRSNSSTPKDNAKQISHQHPKSHGNEDASVADYRSHTPTRVHPDERTPSSANIDRAFAQPPAEEQFSQQQREILLLKQQQLFHYQQLSNLSSNASGYLSGQGPHSNQTQSFLPSHLLGEPDSPQSFHRDLPSSCILDGPQFLTMSRNDSTPTASEVSRATSPTYNLQRHPQARESVQSHGPHQQNQSIGDSVQKFYTPALLSQNHALSHQYSLSQLPFLQQQQQQQQSMYGSPPPVFSNLSHGHGSFSPSSGSFVGSSLARGGSGMSSAGTSFWQDEDGNHSISTFPPSASVAGSKNDYQLEEMQKKIEALERLVQMQTGLPSAGGSPSPSQFGLSLKSGTTSSHLETGAPSVPVREQQPGPAPLQSLPQPPQLQKAQNQRNQNVWGNAGSHSSQNNLTAKASPDQAPSRSSGSTVSKSSSQWLSHQQQQQIAQLQQRLDARGGAGVQDSLIDRSPQDQFDHDMRKRSQSTLGSMHTTFNFNATSPGSNSLSSHKVLGSDGTGDPDPALAQNQVYANRDKSTTILIGSHLNSSSDAKIKSKSSRFLPNLVRRKSVLPEDSTKDVFLSATDSEAMNRVDSNKSGLSSSSSGLAVGAEKEVWNGFSRKHSKTTVKSDEQPVAKFKQGPGRGRVYITPPEKRKKNKD